MIKYIISAFQMAMTALYFWLPEMDDAYLAIGPLAIAGIGLGARFAGDIFGRDPEQTTTSTTTLDPRILKIIMDAVRRGRSNRFLPDTAAFEEQIGLDIEEILSKVPLAEEKLGGELSARGVQRSPQALEQIIREVRAPAVRAAAGAAVAGRTKIEELRLGGEAASEQFFLQLLDILQRAGPRTTVENVKGKIDQLAATFQDAGTFGFEFGVLKELGLFD